MLRADAHQHNTGDRAFPAKDKIAEILVLGEQTRLSRSASAMTSASLKPEAASAT
jgi:hypothetical protein